MTARLTRLNGALHWYDDATKPDLTIVVTCPRCGADTEYVTGSRPGTYERAAVLKCTECRFIGAVRVTLCGREMKVEKEPPLVRASRAVGETEGWRKGQGWESDRIERQQQLPALLGQLGDA